MLSKQEYNLMMGVATKKTLPILSNIMVAGHKIFATDLEMAVYKLTDVEAEGVMPKGVPYEVSSIQQADPTDFPELPSPKDLTDTFTLSAATIKRLAKLAKLASKDTTRPMLNAVAFLNHPDGFPYAVATDGYVLGVEPLPDLDVLKATPNIPARVFAILAKLKGEWTARFYDDVVEFEHEGGLVVMSKVISGAYPDVFTLIKTIAPSYYAFAHRVEPSSPLLAYIKGSKVMRFPDDANTATFTKNKCEIKLPDLPPTAIEATPTEYQRANWHAPFQVIMPLTNSGNGKTVLDMGQLKRLNNPKGFTLHFANDLRTPTAVIVTEGEAK